MPGHASKQELGLCIGNIRKLTVYGGFITKLWLQWTCSAALYGKGCIERSMVALVSLVSLYVCLQCMLSGSSVAVRPFVVCGIRWQSYVWVISVMQLLLHRFCCASWGQSCMGGQTEHLHVSSSQLAQQPSVLCVLRKPSVLCALRKRAPVFCVCSGCCAGKARQ